MARKEGTLMTLAALLLTAAALMALLAFIGWVMGA